MLLIGRVSPVQLSPQVGWLLAAAAGLVLLVAVLRILFEAAIGRLIGTLLRLTGHPPPRKSPARMAIDELESRLRKHSP